MRRKMAFCVLVLCGSLAASAAERQRETLDRGLSARPVAEGKVYLSWRLLETDAQDVGFLIERRAENGSPVTLTAAPIRATTDFLDAAPPASAATYTLRTTKGNETARVRVENPRGGEKAPPYVSIGLDPKTTVQKVGIADLDGDGRYDFVVKTPNTNVDPYIQYWKRSPGTFTLAAYHADGKKLWTHDLGWAIEQGIWYSPYIVYDLDGDGRAEVAVKTGAEGDPRDADGRVMTGPEYLSIWDGRTGASIARIDWPDRAPFLKTNPDPIEAYNYASRNQIGIAYLDGVHPHLIVERGTYNLMVVRAYRFENRQLREVWHWDNAQLDRKYRGQGAHGMHCADVDGDGRDEIILGSLVLDDDGKPLWTTGKGHPDHAYVGDIDPTHPGLEIYYGMETAQKKDGMCLVDAKTGAILWGFDQPTRHVHGQGLCSDIDPSHPGSECYSADTDPNKDFAFARLRSAQGQVLSEENLGGFAPHAVYWDANPQRELIASRRVVDYPTHTTQSARIDGEVIAVADILGDWREEILTTVPGELRIYATTIPATDRRPCLMRDPIYRIDVAHAAMGYFQVPMLSFDLATRKP